MAEPTLDEALESAMEADESEETDSEADDTETTEQAEPQSEPAAGGESGVDESEEEAQSREDGGKTPETVPGARLTVIEQQTNELFAGLGIPPIAVHTGIDPVDYDQVQLAIDQRNWARQVIAQRQGQQSQTDKGPDISGQRDQNSDRLAAVEQFIASTDPDSLESDGERSLFGALASVFEEVKATRDHTGMMLTEFQRQQAGAAQAEFDNACKEIETAHGVTLDDGAKQELLTVSMPFKDVPGMSVRDKLIAGYAVSGGVGKAASKPESGGSGKPDALGLTRAARSRVARTGGVSVPAGAKQEGPVDYATAFEKAWEKHGDKD